MRRRVDRDADGSTAVTDMEYTGQGNLSAVTGPANARGQRYRLDYGYELEGGMNLSPQITEATRQGLTLRFGGGPMPEDWYGVLDAVVEGRLDPMPSVGRIIGLDEVPEALDEARRSDGPPRIVVHPNGDIE